MIRLAVLLLILASFELGRLSLPMPTVTVLRPPAPTMSTPLVATSSTWTSGTETTGNMLPDIGRLNRSDCRPAGIVGWTVCR